MSFLDRVTVLILSYNEAANIARTLAALSWARRIVVIDSGSDDGTADIVQSVANAELVVRPFDNHESQWNFGLAQCRRSEHDWVLALDADYRVSEPLIEEMRRLEPASEVGGYEVGFRYCIFGRPLRASLYPAVIALYRRAGARYEQVGHTQRVVVGGRVERLHGTIDHDDRKPLSRWLLSQIRYARLEAEHLLSAPPGKLRRTDRIRRTGWAAPLLVLPYTLIVRRCLFEGWPGWLYALQRLLAETLIALEIADRRLRK